MIVFIKPCLESYTEHGIGIVKKMLKYGGYITKVNSNIYSFYKLDCDNNDCCWHPLCFNIIKTKEEYETYKKIATKIFNEWSE